MSFTRGGGAEFGSGQGFTLAEVLITLGIIGIIAALTMPSLVAKYQEKVTVTKLKKTYSVLSQAYAQSVNEYGTPDTWDLISRDSLEGAQNMAEKFKPFLNVTGGNNTTVGFGYNLTDGSYILFTIRDKDCKDDRGDGINKNNCAIIGIGFDPKTTKHGIN